MTEPGGSSVGHRPEPPAVARRLSRLLHAGAMLAVAAGGVTTVMGSVELARATTDGPLASGVPEAVGYGLVILFSAIVVLAEAGLWVAFGRLFVRGYAWARAPGTVLAAGNLAVESWRVASPPDPVAAVLSGFEVVLVLGALVVLWSPPMSRYISAVSDWRSVAAL